MKRKEPPCGSRMLDKTENVADAVECRPAPTENATSAERVPAGKPRRTPRKRRKPFVL